MPGPPGQGWPQQQPPGQPYQPAPQQFRSPPVPAQGMPQVPGEAITTRAKRLRAAGEAALRKRLALEIGATREVLIESDKQGRTEHFLPVAIGGETPGTVRALTISGNDGVRLTV